MSHKDIKNIKTIQTEKKYKKPQINEKRIPKTQIKGQQDKKKKRSKKI